MVEKNQYLDRALAAQLRPSSEPTIVPACPGWNRGCFPRV